MKCLTKLAYIFTPESPSTFAAAAPPLRCAPTSLARILDWRPKVYHLPLYWLRIALIMSASMPTFMYSSRPIARRILAYW